MLRTWMRLRSKLEVALPLTIALFAAILAINDLFAGKYDSDEIKISNMRNSSYQWYQSKGIKSTIIEGQIDLLKVLIESDSLVADKRDGMNQLVKQLTAKVERYDREKSEILVGSKQLPKDQWVQDTNGKLGAVVGAKEYDGFLETLGKAGDFFDFASMLFQLCLVTGSVGLLAQRLAVKWTFFQVTVATGFVGICLGIEGLRLALGVVV